MIAAPLDHPEASDAMDILFFQHGNYAEAHARMREGAPETYRDQYRSVRFVDEMSRRANVTVVTFGDTRHDTAITPRLRARGFVVRAFAGRHRGDLRCHGA